MIGFDFIITKHLFTFVIEIKRKIVTEMKKSLLCKCIIIILRYHILLSLGIRYRSAYAGFFCIIYKIISNYI